MRDRNSGDAEAAYRSERDGLMRFALLLTNDVYKSEDLVAEAVARSWVRLNKGTIDDAGRYLRRVIANQVIDSGRRGVIANRFRRLRNADAGEDPERVAVLSADLAAALARLSTEHRVVLVCRFYEDMSEAAIASLLGLSLGTVKSRTSRALSRLREIYGETQDG